MAHRKVQDGEGIAPHTMRFGVVLRQQRVLRKLTQEQLAWSTKMSRVYISEMERGLREPSLGTILKLCHALDVSPGEFMAEVSAAMRSL